MLVDRRQRGKIQRTSDLLETRRVALPVDESYQEIQNLFLTPR